MSWQARKRLFKIQAFRQYSLSCMLAMIGNGLSYIAMTWMVLQFHNSITSVVIVMFAFWLPSVILGPFAGVIVDRVSRKVLFCRINHLRGVLLVALGVIEIYHPSLDAIYWMSLLQGILFSFVLPVVISMIREIVPEADLLMANATVDIAYEIGNVLGMAFAGFLIAWMTAAGSYIFTGVMFVIAGFIAQPMRLEFATALSRRSLGLASVLHDLTAGLRYIMSRREICVIYSVQLLVMVSFMTVPILSAPFATTLLHTTVGQFGMLEAMLSVGVILGGFCVPSLAERYGLLVILVVLLVVLSVCYTLFSMNRNIQIAEALNFIIGFGLAVWPLIMTRAQDLTAKEFQGRVQASFNSLSGFLILCIYTIVNFGSHHIGLAHLYWIEVVFSAVGIVLLLTNFSVLKKR
jgi:MFS transporter, DHA3 family, macrolide efflux protein